MTVWHHSRLSVILDLSVEQMFFLKVWVCFCIQSSSGWDGLNLKSLPAAASLLIFHQKRRSCSGRNWIQMSHLFLLVSFHQQYRLEVVSRTTWFVRNQEDPTQNPSGPNYHQLSLSNQDLSGFSSCHQSLVSVKSRQSECGRWSFLNSHFYTVLIVRLGKGTKPAQIGLKKRSCFRSKYPVLWLEMFRRLVRNIQFLSQRTWLELVLRYL